MNTQQEPTKTGKISVMTPFEGIADDYGVTTDELRYLLKFHPDKNKRNKFIVFMIGVLLTPVTLAGALLGYVRGYNRFVRHHRLFPVFYPLSPPVRAAMVIGAALIWVALIGLLLLFVPIAWISGSYTPAVITYMGINLLFSLAVYACFVAWETGVNNALVEGTKFGSARLATKLDLIHLENQKGIFIGGSHAYSKQGHILTVAGSRSGKFTNLIATNLLGFGDIDGSWVVIDPKGEIAAVTARYQRESGQNVVILNPWNLLAERLGAGDNYNPLDILEVTSPHLVDDCHMLAEMLVPVEQGRNKFFSDSARTVISGLILFIAVSKQGEERNLKTLWKVVRYPQVEWDRVLAEMEQWGDVIQNEEETITEDREQKEDPIGENLLYASTEIEKLVKSGSNTWGSILSTVLQATDFLKSPALQQSLASGFDPKTLAHRNTTVYVVIPADKLQSHSRWLRLLVTSTMRAVIRKPNKRVCFILDEFAALGYLPEIEIALGAYAAFNVTVWPILQSLVQLQNLYQLNWEVFVGNAAVRHFFGINNNFDANYISTAVGKTSHVLTTRRWFGIKDAQSTLRDLITADEVRVESGSKIILFVDDLPPAMIPKLPYYEIGDIKDRADKNPYI